MKKGLIHIYCGDGKGKTTAAMGLAIRAAGREKKVFITQFLKSGKSGELVSLDKLKDYVTLQIVAFPQEGILSYPNGLELLEESLKLGADVVGSIPHFKFTREYGVESINKMIELAKKYDVLVDVHCDEIDD